MREILKEVVEDERGEVWKEERKERKGWRKETRRGGEKGREE